MNDDVIARLNEALAGRYLVEREHAFGGMATVYLAEDLKHHRKVAIKVLRSELAMVLGRDRFVREIEIAAKLQHPHILPLYDSGDAGGLLYYVMPFVEGDSLRHLLEREHQLPFERAAQITREVAQALEFAHSRGIVHRDIKPENILFSDGVAVVADFGIAQAVAEAGGSRLTQTGFSLGTPTYMSPEQGTGAAIDGRSDVYSLACVTFEMLTGEPPYAGASALALLARHSSDPIPNVGTLRAAVPRRVESILKKALAKVPGDRYPSVMTFASEFGGAVTGPVPTVEDATRSAGRRRILGLVTALLVLVGAGAAWYASRRPPAPARAPKIAILPFSHIGAPEDRFIADGLTEEIRSRVAGISGLVVIAGSSTGQYDGNVRIKDLARDLGVDYVVIGSVQTQRGAQGAEQLRVRPRLVRAGNEEELWHPTLDGSLTPGELFRVQADIAEQIASALGVSLLSPERRDLAARPTANSASYEAFLRGNVAVARRYAETSARTAIESYQAAVGADSNFALAYAKLAEAEVFYYYFHDRNRERLGRARVAIDRAMTLDSTLVEAHVARGYLAWWGDLDQTRALEELNEVRTRQPSNSDALWIIANILRRNGRWSEGMAALRRAGELDPRSQSYALDLATSSMAIRRFDDADRYLSRALTLAPDWAPAILTKSLLLVAWKGDVAASRQVVAEARARNGVSVGELLKYMVRRHPQHVFILGGDIQDSLDAMKAGTMLEAGPLMLAKAYSFTNRGNLSRARAYFDSARVVFEGLVKVSPGEADFHAMLGVAYAALGHREESIHEGIEGMKLLPVEKEALGGIFPITARIRIALINGETDTAFKYIAALIQIPSPLSKALLKVEPMFAALRSDPRFEALIRGTENTL